MLKSFSNVFLLTVCLLLINACQEEKKLQGEALYNQQCARCHIAPNIQDLPKHIWKENILPDMGARMGFSTPGYNPYKGFSFEETMAMMETKIYSPTPIISHEQWKILQDYIISHAPDTLRASKDALEISRDLDLFQLKEIKIDETPGSFITYLEYLPEKNILALGDLQNQLRFFSFKHNKIIRTIPGNSPVISYNNIGGEEYITQIGRLNPSEISTGEFSILKQNNLISLDKQLHRPVYNSADDLDNDGRADFVISEFGNLTGKITLLTTQKDSITSKVLMDGPGTIRTVIIDMNRDGMKDIVALTSQGDESITIFYQDSPLQFVAEKVIKFSPVYGTSWFEIMDYDQDGDMDIATVHGDNADKSQISKPYHGLRIHINNGRNEFEETYFHPINGATRLLARDFDKDNDIDFAVIATFPDYNKEPIRSFIFLENKNSNNYMFKASTFKEVEKARWFLFDAGDVDKDGDLDIIVSSFSYAFVPIPKQIERVWKENDIDIIILENNLFK